MVYIDTTYAEDNATGIGKTVNGILRVFNINCIKFKQITIPKGNAILQFLRFNYKMRKYCKSHLSNEDIYFIPNNLSKYFFLPHIKTWVLIHDLIPLTKFGHKGLKRFLYKLKMRQLKNVDRIITISETVKKQIIDNYNIDSTKIDVLYWPADSPLATDKQDPELYLESPYILGIGTGEPRKDIESIIRIWNKIAPKYLNLLLFGGEWRKGIHARLNELIKSLGLEQRVILLGKVSEEQLNILYKNAQSFIFPSQEEGFGLPPLEALTRGTSIILPKTPINYELYGGIANMYSLGNIDELKQAIENGIIENKNPKLIEYTEKFSLNSFSTKIKSIFS